MPGLSSVRFWSKLARRADKYDVTDVAHPQALRLRRTASRPGFAAAAALAGYCHMENVLRSYAINPQFERKEAVRLVRLALRRW